MFRLMFMLFGLMLSWMLDTDDGGDPPDDGDNDNNDGKDEPYKRLEFKTKEEADAHYNQVFTERDKRIREQIREEERTEAEKEAKNKAAKEKEDYKSLYEGAEQTIEEQKTRISELEGKASEAETASERITALEERLKGLIAPDLEAVDEMYREFVEAMDVEKQAEWIEKNREKLTSTQTQRPRGSRATGKPRERRENGDNEEAQRRQAQTTRAAF
jgi:myosin heavy subunit